MKNSPQKETNNYDFFQLGSLQIPISYILQHLFIKGTTGAGKSLIINGLVKSLFTNPQYGQNYNGIILDVKGDLLPKLYPIIGKNRLILLQPLDLRGFAWDLAADINNPAAAEAISNIIVPKDTNEKTPFFTQAVATLLYGVFKFLMRHADGKYDLRDVLLLMRNLELTKKLLSSDPYTKNHLNSLQNADTTADILATITNKLQPYEVIAACWHRCPQKFSLTEFINSNQVLVIGLDDTISASLNAIVAAFLNRAFQMLLRQSESLQPKHFVILDEIPSLPEITMLPRLMTKARSKGVSVTLGLQSIEQFRFIYQKELADTIVDQCLTKCLLRLNSPASSKYASELIGDVLLKESTYSRTFDRADMIPGHHTQNQQIQKREAVLASEFLNIPVTNKRNGLTGYYRIADKVAKISMPWGEIEEKLLPPVNQDSGELGFAAVPDEYQWLEPFSDADYLRLGLKNTITLNSSNQSQSNLDQLGEDLKSLKLDKA